MTLIELFTNIANAIRTKKGTSDKILASDFAIEIENLPSGGGSSEEYFVGELSENNTAYSLLFKNIKKIPNMKIKSNSCKYMFYGCENLETIPLLDTTNVTTFESMFESCTNLTSIPLIDTSNGTSFKSMFESCANLTTIPELNTANGTYFSLMFYRSTNLKSVPNLNTSNGIDFGSMFSGCKNLKSVPNLNTSNGTNFSSMFSGCKSLTSIPNLDTSNGTDLKSMFSDCDNLTTIPLINTSNGTSFSAMFYNCDNLTTIPLIDTSNGTNFSSMFSGCTNLTTIPNLDTSNGTDFSNMFYYCTKIETLPLLNLGKCTKIGTGFANTPNLVNCYGFKDLGKAYSQKTNNYTNYSISFSKNNLLTHDSLINIINNLYDLNLSYDVANGGTLYTQSLQLGSTNKAKLTAEEIAIATSKRMDYFIKEELNMQYIGYTKPILLVADKGKKIRGINDIYIPATEEEPEHIPYYTDVVFLADGITEQQAFEMYVEEVVE